MMQDMQVRLQQMQCNGQHSKAEALQHEMQQRQLQLTQRAASCLHSSAEISCNRKLAHLHHVAGLLAQRYFDLVPRLRAHTQVLCLLALRLEDAH